MPDATPVTTPVDKPTVACAVVLLLHVPVPVVSLSVKVDPTQIVPLLLNIAVIGLTVMLKSRLQPVGNVYTIVSLPGAIPVTICELLPTVATDVFVLLHTPPTVPSDRLVMDPIHTVLLPVMEPGNGLTVTVAVA